MNNNEILLLKLGEVVLKGLNRKVFEDRLLNNVRRRLRHCGSFQVYVRQSTIYVEPQDASCDLESAYAACRQVFGIAAVARPSPAKKRWRPSRPLPRPILPAALPPPAASRWRASGPTRPLP